MDVNPYQTPTHSEALRLPAPTERGLTLARVFDLFALVITAMLICLALGYALTPGIR
jgi:hypothetical protein